MGKWKGITADELIMLRQIERINYQLRAVAKEFGTNSRLYRHYENFLTSTKKNTLADAGLIRETKEGILQIRADKAAVREIGTYTAYTKAVSRLQKFRTVGEQKQHMIEAFAKRTKTDLEKSKAKWERDLMYLAEKSFERTVYEQINDLLIKYYELEKEAANGKEFVSHDELRKLSTGSHTSAEDLKKMVEVAKKEIAAEQHNIKQQYDDYLAGL